MEKVRVGFIGAGQFISFSHLPTVMQSDIMETGAIADLSRATLDRHRAALPRARFTTDYRELLADPAIDLVVIGTRQDLHARLIIESLDAGKWVYCEKPMAETLEEIDAVLAAERRNAGRARLAIGLNRRFAPAYADARRLMQRTPRPWFFSYRLMAPHLTTGEKDDFYRDRPRIVYEGCHILDLVCWFLDADPVRVFMTGDRLRNNCCILEYADGSNVSFLCGSIGSFCLWKEYMEVFSPGHSITVSDFIDMRVRGFAGEFDRLYPLDRGAHEEICRLGFDYYEVSRVNEIAGNAESVTLIGGAGMTIEQVRRRPMIPEAASAASAVRGPAVPYFDNPDKGRVQALEHFARCLRTGQTPQNAAGAAGARSTLLGLALLKSLETRAAVDYPPAALNAARAVARG